MALSPGTRLGPYEILSAIGAGGMGEVYRAEDSRLKRTVAIKVLAPDVATPDRIERLEHEARAASAIFARPSRSARQAASERARPEGVSSRSGITSPAPLFAK